MPDRDGGVEQRCAACDGVVIGDGNEIHKTGGGAEKRCVDNGVIMSDREGGVKKSCVVDGVVVGDGM